MSDEYFDLLVAKSMVSKYGLSFKASKEIVDNYTLVLSTLKLFHKNVDEQAELLYEAYKSNVFPESWINWANQLNKKYKNDNWRQTK